MTTVVVAFVADLHAGLVAALDFLGVGDVDEAVAVLRELEDDLLAVLTAERGEEEAA